MKMIRGKSKGSITVFLTLVLLLILSLIGACLENARVKVASIQMERNLSGSLDATLTEYYKPLYDDYRVFFMDRGSESQQMEEKALKEQIMEYCRQSLETQTSTELFGIENTTNGMNLLGTKIKSVKVDGAVRATDYRGTLFYDQVIQYMKYAVIADQCKLGMKNVGVMSDCEATASIMEQESKTDKTFSEAGTLLLQLMEQVEGVKIDGQGLVYKTDDRLAVVGTFAKEYCIGQASKQRVGIANDTVWNSTKDYYKDPSTSCQKLITGCQELITETEKKEEAERVKAEQEAAGEVVEEDDSEEEETYDFAAKIEELNKLQKSFKDTVSSVRGKYEAAIVTIGKMENKQTEISKKATDFTDTTNRKKDKISEDEYQVLQDSNAQMKKDEEVIANAIALKPQLQKNVQILKALEENLREDIVEDRTSYEEKQQQMEAQMTALAGYEISGLTFDYGTLGKKADVENPVDQLSSISGNVLDLVQDETKTLSKKKLRKADHYYQRYKSGEDKTSNAEIKDSIVGGELAEAFGAVSDVFGGEKKLTNILSDASDTLLYQAYIKDYFSSYVTNTNRFRKTPLDYEQEYILCGEDSDKKNLEKVVDRILLIRTVINFSYLLTDQTKMEKAHATALLLVGFSGIDALVRVTQFAILAAWAYEESLVDAAALLHGYEVPLLKNNNTFCMKYSDILTFDKNKIKEKIDVIKARRNVTGISYEDYLNLFLLFEKQVEKTYRTMDLIEENMKLRHSKLFSFEQCIYALDASCEYQVPAKFAALGFMKKWGYADKNWNFTVHQTYSY